jgi:type VI secretion system protein ImpA
MKQAIEDIWGKKRIAEPASRPAADLATGAVPIEQVQLAAPEDPVGVRIPLSLHSLQEFPSAGGGSWADAEALIRSAQVEKGLAEMTRLVASETNGRSRFQRKLLLAEACLSSKRVRLARLVLEELAEQIDKFQLELWESPALIASVWTKLYRLYKFDPESSDLERANKLYERLCRLDPWQALSCAEG